MTTYDVDAHRSGAWWALEFPEYPRVHSQTKRLDQVPAMAADALSLALGMPVGDEQIVVHPHLDHFVEKVTVYARNERLQAEAQAASAQRATLRAIFVGVDSGLTTRDVGALLGVSHQYVAKILKNRVELELELGD